MLADTYTLNPTTVIDAATQVFGNGNNRKIPKWGAYSGPNRETLLFNDQCRVMNAPRHAARIAIEKVLKFNLAVLSSFAEPASASETAQPEGNSS